MPNHWSTTVASGASPIARPKCCTALCFLSQGSSCVRRRNGRTMHAADAARQITCRTEGVNTTDGAVERRTSHEEPVLHSWHHSNTDHATERCRNPKNKTYIYYWCPKHSPHTRRTTAAGNNVTSNFLSYYECSHTWLELRSSGKPPSLVPPLLTCAMPLDS